LISVAFVCEGDSRCESSQNIQKLLRSLDFGSFCHSYSLPSIKIDIKNQELALRRFAPQRLIFHWENQKESGGAKRRHSLWKCKF